MDSYKLKKIVTTIIVFIITIILVSIVFTSVISSVKRQLKQEKEREITGETIQQLHSTDKDIQDEEDSSDSNGSLEINFNEIINHLKSGRLNILLASLQILIGVNMVIISILILVRLKKSDQIF